MPQAHVDGHDTEATVNGGYKERFGRYLLLERLGRGGMAEVFKAVAEGAQGFRRVFVVKRILPEFAASPYFVSLFADEAKLSALLHHPNLVQVYEFGAVAGVHYLSMEYLDGTDLASAMTGLTKLNEKMPPSLAVFIAQQVAHGLAYAHAAQDERGAPLRLVHRDVSPENIMLMDAGTVKLFDFGIALSDQRFATSITQGKVLKGKLAYSSPEQVKGQPMDGRSDIFSLGVVLWEMLTGRRLFAADEDARTLYNVLEREVVPPSTINPAVPPELDRVVLRALAREPGRRQSNADVLSEELDDILRALPHHRTHLPKLLARVAVGRSGIRGAPPPAPTTVQAGVIEQEETTDETTALKIFPQPDRAETRLVALEEVVLLPEGDGHLPKERAPGGEQGAVSANQSEVPAEESSCAEASPEVDLERLVATDMSLPAWRPRTRSAAALRAGLALAAAGALLGVVRGFALRSTSQSADLEGRPAVAWPMATMDRPGPAPMPAPPAVELSAPVAVQARPPLPEPSARPPQAVKLPTLPAEAPEPDRAMVFEVSVTEDDLAADGARASEDSPSLSQPQEAPIAETARPRSPGVRRLALRAPQPPLRIRPAPPPPLATPDGLHVDPFAP